MYRHPLGERKNFMSLFFANFISQKAIKIDRVLPKLLSKQRVDFKLCVFVYVLSTQMQLAH